MSIKPIIQHLKQKIKENSLNLNNYKIDNFQFIKDNIDDIGEHFELAHYTYEEFAQEFNMSIEDFDNLLIKTVDKLLNKKTLIKK